MPTELFNLSLPLRKCGLKYGNESAYRLPCQVTSLAEVWIEIKGKRMLPFLHLVTSLAEVWIEICPHGIPRHCLGSLPLRKCGLKWKKILMWGKRERHFPCGSVD